MMKLAGLLLILLTLCSCMDSGRDEEQVIRIGYHPNFGGSSAVAIAMECGFFEEEGIAAELVMYQSGPSSIGGLLAEDVDVSFLGHGALGLAIESDTVIFALDSLSFAEEILATASSGIRTLGDLQGRKIAVPFSTSAENFLLSVLDYHAIGTDDIDIINMDVAGCVSAIAEGYAEAVAVWAPYNSEIRQALGENAISVADCMDYKDVLYFPMYWVADRDFMEKHEDTLASFIRALQKALDWRSGNLQESVNIVSAFLGREQSELLPDILTAEWFGSDDAFALLSDGTAEGMFRNLFETLRDRGRIRLPAHKMKDWYDFHLLFQILAEKEEGTCY